MLLKRECADGLLQSETVACVPSMRAVSGCTLSVWCMSVSMQTINTNRNSHERLLLRRKDEPWWLELEAQA